MVASYDTWTEILDNSPSSGPEVAVPCPNAIYYFFLSEAQGRRQHFGCSSFPNYDHQNRLIIRKTTIYFGQTCILLGPIFIVKVFTSLLKQNYKASPRWFSLSIQENKFNRKAAIISQTQKEMVFSPMKLFTHNHKVIENFLSRPFLGTLVRIYYSFRVNVLQPPRGLSNTLLIP